MENAIKKILGIGKEPTHLERELRNILAGEVLGDVEIGRTGKLQEDNFTIIDYNEEDL